MLLSCCTVLDSTLGLSQLAAAYGVAIEESVKLDPTGVEVLSRKGRDVDCDKDDSGLKPVGVGVGRGGRR